MAGIFINYRRKDGKWPASQVYNAIKERSGKSSVFIDVRDIPGGIKFSDHLANTVRDCDFMVSIIGSLWLDLLSNRLDSDDADYVRLELDLAFKNGLKVVPVLIDGAPMPLASDLPDELSWLCELQAIELDPNNFEEGLEKIARSIGIGVTLSQAEIDRRKSLFYEGFNDFKKHVRTDLRGYAQSACSIYHGKLRDPSAEEQLRDALRQVSLDLRTEFLELIDEKHDKIFEHLAVPESDVSDLVETVKVRFGYPPVFNFTVFKDVFASADEKIKKDRELLEDLIDRIASYICNELDKMADYCWGNHSPKFR